MLTVSPSAFSYQMRYLQSGDHALGLLRKHGFTNSDREKASSLPDFKTLASLTLNLENPYLLEKTKTKVEIIFFDATRERAVQVIKSRGQIQVKSLSNPYRKQKVTLKGSFRGPIANQIFRQTRSRWLSTRLHDIYFTEDLSDLSSGQYQLEVEKLLYSGKVIRFGEILKAEIKAKGRRYVREFHPLKTGGVAVNPKDPGLERDFFAPVTYLRIASPFSPRRLHPVTGRRLPHMGVDFDIPVGTAVYAPKRGVVSRVGYQKGAGHYLMIRHASGWESMYFHLSRAPRLRQGQKIEAGEIIALSGNSGYSTSPHLHFGLRRKGRFVDPLDYMKEYPKIAEMKILRSIAQR